jgi:hypothetical protein
MIRSLCCVAAAAALLAAPVALAQSPAEPAPAAAPAFKSGSMLVSADGKRIGRIERVVRGSDGTPLSAAVIFDSRFVYIPASSISAANGRFATTLTQSEVRKLK